MAVAVQSSAVELRTQELLTQLKEGVSQLVTSQGWQDYLRVQARFHHYSANNVMLILIQKPDASRIAGFQRWKQLGRYVKRGEPGISIFAPVTHKIRTTTDEDEDATFFKVVGFKIVHVFDIGQTDGKPLPEHPIKKLDTSGTVELMQTMLGVANKLGVTVEFCNAGGPNGYYQSHANRIVVEVKNHPSQQLKTLVHEYSHSLLHSKYESDIARQQREVEAESAAYIVCNYFGLDSADYSFAYVASWSGCDPEAVLHYAQRIQKAATTIIDLVEQTQK